MQYTEDWFRKFRYLRCVISERVTNKKFVEDCVYQSYLVVGMKIKVAVEVKGDLMADNTRQNTCLER
jgi:hypothetical protein